MELSEGIRRIGFRRWYERQLIESHLYLVSWFLCLIMVLACLEGFSFRAPGWEPVLRLVAMIAGTALSLWSIRRYFAALGFAEHAAKRSICAKCASYGLLEMAEEEELARRAGRVERTLPPVAVRCRKCGNEWIID
jgi:ribosomal protein L40E